LSPIQAQKPLPVIPLPIAETKREEPDLPSWMSGKAELQILGCGGESGAELKIFIGQQVRHSVR